MMDEFLFCVGIIGHRYFGDKNIDLFVQSCCYNILTDFKKKHKNIKGISALSPGADSIFAQVVVSLNINLETVIPFYDFQLDFQDETSCEINKKLRAYSTNENKVNFTNRNIFAYKKSMEWVVFKSNTVIAVWDGKKVGSMGGTWEAIMLCKDLSKPLIDINTINRTVNYVTK